MSVNLSRLCVAWSLAVAGSTDRGWPRGVPVPACPVCAAPVELCGWIVLCVAHPVMDSRPFEKVRLLDVGSDEAISRWRDRHRQARCHSARPWSPVVQSGMAPVGVLQLATVAYGNRHSVGGGGLGMGMATRGALEASVRRACWAAATNSRASGRRNSMVDLGAGRGRHSVKRPAR